jgi:tRNA-2-methylthio-N6-dimethylallyladenosine synthase
MNPKLHISTHGCQMNEYDSSRMRDLLEKEFAAEWTDSPADADILLLNTCSIRDKAQEKVFHQLGRWRPLKKTNPQLIIGVGGCVASQEGEALRHRAPYVDVIFGPQTLHRLPELIRQAQNSQRKVIDISFPTIEKFDHLPQPRVEGPRAFVSIMEGCSKYCSFCVVPYTRGEEVSRPHQDVLTEIQHLAAQGVREVTLLGQNVNGYRSPTDDLRFADLLRLIDGVKGIERIRYTTSHPLEFGDDLIQAHADLRSLVDHIHLPVQSGSDRVLSMMKRNYTALEYKSIIRKLRAQQPNISISSDFIVGFPGETDEDFADTMKLIEHIGFDQSYSFIYSPRAGTPAASLADDTPMEVKKQRLNILQARVTQHAQRISEQMLDSIQPVLVDGYSKKDPGQLQGRTTNNRVVNFSSQDDALIGQFAGVRITKVSYNSLIGELVSTN